MAVNALCTAWDIVDIHSLRIANGFPICTYRVNGGIWTALDGLISTAAISLVKSRGTEFM